MKAASGLKLESQTYSFSISPIYSKVTLGHINGLWRQMNALSNLRTSPKKKTNNGQVDAMNFKF